MLHRVMPADAEVKVIVWDFFFPAQDILVKVGPWASHEVVDLG